MTTPSLRAVDELLVDIAVDNLSDNYSTKPAHVSPEFVNVVEAGAEELSGTTLCCAQLGLALVLTVRRGFRRHMLLFDAGPEGPLFLRNCRNLGVALAGVEAVAISHGHCDHMGGLLDALDGVAPSAGGRRVPCHVNPGMFAERGVRLTNGQMVRVQNVPSPEAPERSLTGGSGPARCRRRECIGGAAATRRVLLSQWRDSAGHFSREGKA